MSESMSPRQRAADAVAKSAIALARLQEQRDAARAQVDALAEALERCACDEDRTLTVHRCLRSRPRPNCLSCRTLAAYREGRG